MNTTEIIAALDLPRSTIVGQRVAKKLLNDNGAVTSADKRHINDGVEELTWVAALKQNSVGVPAFRDDLREYLEIAVLLLVLRPAAKAARITELIHRAIPYPVLLVSAQGDSLSLSMANKRYAQNDPGKMVLDDGITECALVGHSETPSLLKGLALTLQPRAHLFALYQGWLACLEAFRAAQITGRLEMPTDSAGQETRRKALAEYSRLEREISALRSQAEKEKQINRRVELNLEVKRLSAELAATNKLLSEKSS
jgi:hypothetical protein